MLQQVGADVTGKLVSDDIGEQTKKTIENLEAILESAGSSLSRVLKVNIYLPDQANYAGMNEVYARVCYPAYNTAPLEGLSVFLSYR